MKTVKQQIYELIQKESALHYKDGISTSDIASLMEMQRSNVSAILNELVKEEKLTKTNTRPVLYLPSNVLDENKAEKVFENVVGCKGSLRNAIQLAKAAVLYPERHKSILLRSKPGCGTSYFASLIYDYAKASKVINDDGQFIKVTARHFIKNIEQVSDLLFGNGLNNSGNCFQLAQGGVLFIDNFDLLDGNQQSKIYRYLETGLIYDEQTSSTIDYSNVFCIISANSNYSGQLEQKMPFIIELTELNQRSLEERFELINHFFAIEAHRAKHNIAVSKESMAALLLADYPNNVKELNYIVKSSCANAYVRIMDDKDADMNVVVDDLKSSCKHALLKYRDNAQQIDQLLADQDYIYYDQNTGYLRSDLFLVGNIYNKLQKQYDELIKRGISEQSTTDVINNQVKTLFSMFKFNTSETLNRSQLSKIVDERIIDLVYLLRKEVELHLDRLLSSSSFYGLCLHLNALLTGSSVGQRISDQQISDTIQKYPKEFAICTQFALFIKDKLNIDLDTSEIVLLVLFILDTNEDEKQHPVLLYIMHGSGIAKCLADATNALTHAHNAFSYDMELSMDTKNAMEDIKQLIISIDRGAGVFIIYDMGSINTMIETISEEVNIKIRTLAIPITLIGIDIARKCAMQSNIDDIYHMAIKDTNLYFSKEVHRNSILITLCHTGEGGAMQLKSYIDLYSKLGFTTVALSISNRDQLLKEVIALKKTGNIHAFVGTYDPKLLGIPFISINKIFENSKDDLDRILTFEPINSGLRDYSKVYQHLQTSLVCASIPKIKEVLPNIVDELSIIYSLDSEVQMGLFVHLAASIDRILQGKPTKTDNNAVQLLQSHEQDARVIAKCMKPLEKAFKIIIDDNELAILLRIILKI